MRVAKDNVDVRMEIPGAVIRQRTDFGNVSGFGTISGEYFTLSAGVDTTPLFQGLEGDLCQCPTGALSYVARSLPLMRSACRRR